MYSPKEYWAEVAERYRSMDTSGLAPVLNPRAPSWFNDATDYLQLRALQRAIAIAQVPPGARFLDVGCGTGRWVRRYRELGFSPVGVDATEGMLRIARSHQTMSPMIVGLAYQLPLASEVFDSLSVITVIQHIPYERHGETLREMVRVLKPGGRLILFELIQGASFHIFSRRPRDWIRQVESCGATLIDYFGQEYFFLDRMLVRLMQILSKRRGKDASEAHIRPGGSGSTEASLARRAYWGIRRLIVRFSVWIEPALVNSMPIRLATHAVFVFRKVG
jgi:ubiquinone/menaquinone biosynthesis C-methylase UbiE